MIRAISRRATAIAATSLMAVVLAACSGGTSPSVDPPAPAEPSPSATMAEAEACPAIVLSGPDGSPVDLNGEWGEGEWFQTPGTNERTFLLQRGVCVWATIMDAEFRAGPAPEASQLAIFYGLLSHDFTIDGTLVLMQRWNDPFSFGTQALGPTPFGLRVEFDADGAPVLREDREPGVEGPRCPNPTMWCPDPTVLHLVEPQPEQPN